MAQRPRVLLIGPLPPPVHGVTLCLQNLLQHREQLPVELVHLDSRFTDSHAELGQFSLRKVRLLLRYLWQLFCQLCCGKISLVITTPTFYFKPFLKDSLFIWLSWLSRKPTAGWIHNDFRFLLANVHGWKLRYVKWTLRRLDNLIFVAPRLQQYAPDWLEPARFTSILNGIATPSQTRANHAGSHQPLRFVYLSQMNEQKGWRTLLEAAAILSQRGHHPEIHFYGKPAFETTATMIESSIQAARERSLNVAWHGPVYEEAKWQALATADVFVFPSWHEAFPLAILDAMAVGLPIVASDVGGVADALPSEQLPFLIPSQNAPLLAEAMERFINDPATREACRQANRSRYETHFTTAAFAKRWADYFTSRPFLFDQIHP
jgi:glycosyltransferase involved in cell wall biosynthesis